MVVYAFNPIISIVFNHLHFFEELSDLFVHLLIRLFVSFGF
jgi:hypothetical protein